ncbi:MAG: heme A synthase [Pelagibacteraceae bacterium]|jgi:cytochrome c oxidase assembly protein subunit 15|nr:MAG: heme A synthase [Pelagibacteraceae bacterium]
MYKSENFQISLWLVSLMSIILLMIIVGGLTRLTESGLSMVDWRLFMGTIPPLSHGDWLKVFEDYKQYPEYQIKNINMTLSEFKYIFWWEYGHRVLGRLIGIIFIIPFIYFALKKYFSNEELYSYSFLLFLGGAQGIIGWWMVKSGLDVNPYVSHLRLAVHLIIAQIILSLIAYLFLKRLDIGIYKNNFSSHKTFFIFFNIIIFFTVIYGAFMAGLDAGKSFNTWPKMGDNYIPENLIFIEDRLFGFFDNSVFIHFFHRALAYLSFLTILYMCFKHFKGIENKYQKIHFLIVLFLVLIQLFIGVFVVLSNVQVSLGSIHQIIGTLLFVSATCYSLQILKN